MIGEDRPIIVFDALCVLCSANARFVLKHDRRARFRLASMQGAAGAALYRRFGIDAASPESFILVSAGRALRQSDAVLAICWGLGWPWRLAVLARIVPRFVRDALYRWVARNRYNWFGRRDACWLPDAKWQDRML